MTSSGSAPVTLHHPPSACPVCGQGLMVTRLGCAGCGTELAATFASCEFCALAPEDLATLKVFLASRGNMREVERHLGVSYPTARLRFSQILVKLGLADATTTDASDAQTDAATGTPTRDQILAEVASGALDPAEAQRLLEQL